MLTAALAIVFGVLVGAPAIAAAVNGPDWRMLSTRFNPAFATATVTHRYADIDFRVAAALGGTAWRADVFAEIPSDILGF